MLSGNEGDREEVPTVEGWWWKRVGNREISDALMSGKGPRCRVEESKAESLRWTSYGSKMGLAPTLLIPGYCLSVG